MLFAILLLGLADPDLISVSNPPSFSRLFRLGTNTVLMSLLAGLLATVFGLLAVSVIQEMPSRLRPLLTGLVILPVFISPPVMAIVAVRLLGPAGWLSDFLTGSQATFAITTRATGEVSNLVAAPIYSLWGGGLTLAWLLYPFALLLLGRAWGLMPADVMDAARLETTSRWKLFFKIRFRHLLPAIVTSFSLVTFLAMMEFGIPEALRSLPVLVSEVYVQAGVFYDLRSATLVGLLLVIIGVVFLVPGLCWIDEAVEGDGVRFSATKGTLRPLSWLGAIVVLLPLLLIFFVLFMTATGPQGRMVVWETAVETGYQEIFKSLYLGLIAVPFILIAGFLLGLGIWKSRLRLVSRILCLLPFLTPSPLLALAMQQFLRLPDRYGVEDVGDVLHGFSQTHGPLVFIWCLRFAPLVAIFVESVLRYSITRETRLLMSLERSSITQSITGIFLPLSAPALVISGVVVFGLCLSEVGAAVLLMPPGITNLGVRLLTQMHYAPTGQISALALLMVLPGILFSLGPAFGWKWLQKFSHEK